MFERFGIYNVVLVTGPQRSGTTICARMIEHDTGLQDMGEQEFSATNEEQWGESVAGAAKAVMQCPGMARFIHEFGARHDLAVVFMIRSLTEVIASQRRINWAYEQFELKRYPAIYRNMPVAAAKLMYWMSFQKRRIANAYEVDYATLEKHPLWIPPGQRLDFHARQWNDATA